MSKFEADYKNHHQNRQDHNFEGDQLWGAIAQELDAKRGKRRPLFWIWAGICMGILGSVAALCTQETSHPARRAAHPDVHTALNSESVAITYRISTNSATLSASDTFIQPSDFKPMEVNTDGTSLDGQPASHVSATDPTPNANPMLSGLPETPSALPALGISQMDASRPSSRPKAYAPSTPPSAWPLASVGTLQQVPSLPWATLSAKAPDRHPHLAPLELANLPSDDGLKHFEFSLHTGPNWSAMHFKNPSTSADLNALTTSDSGWGARGEFTWDTPLNWRFTTGISWEVWNVRFDYHHTREFARTLENQLIGFEEMDGQTVAVYGDKTVNVRQTRTVIHHNHFTQLGVPLLIGRKIQRHQHAWGLDAGFTPRLVLGQSGKTLDGEQNVTQFENGADDLPLRTFQVSVTARAFYQIQINPRWGVRTTVRYDRTLRGGSGWHGGTLGMGQIATEAGLVFRSGR